MIWIATCLVVSALYAYAGTQFLYDDEILATCFYWTCSIVFVWAALAEFFRPRPRR